MDKKLPHSQIYGYYRVISNVRKKKTNTLLTCGVEAIHSMYPHFSTYDK